MEYDVIVVGGGPAGSTAAKVLAEKSVKVVVADKKSFPRDKPCGGGLLPHVLERFPYTKEFVENEVFGVVIWSPSLKYKVERAGSEPSCVMCLREKFDYSLLELAKEKGVDVVEGSAVKDVIVKKDHVEVTLTDGDKLKGEVVIGADGVNGVVAKRTGLNPKWDTASLALCVEIEPKIQRDATLRYYAEKGMLIHLLYGGTVGYGWVFDKGERINVGIGNMLNFSTEKLTNTFTNYVDFLRKEKLIPDIKVKNVKAHLVPLGGYIEKTYTDRVVLCGDAAGFVSPLSGEGIYYAMSSGETAANIIADALKQNDTSERFLSAYEKLWMEDFGKDLRMYLWFQKYMLNKGRAEKLIKFGTKDDKFKDAILDIFLASVPAREYRWTVVRRYMINWIKEKISLRGSEGGTKVA